jgi:hypothetical protein
MADDRTVARWFIDLNWLEQNNRSFLALAQGCLCPKCLERMEGGKKQFSSADLLSNIRDCCSKTPEFFIDRLPILESVFRIFLANGNQPLGLEELSEQLVEQRGSAPHHTSTEMLFRLLGNERYYGLRRVT